MARVSGYGGNICWAVISLGKFSPRWGEQKVISERACVDLSNCFSQTLEYPKRAGLSARMSQKDRRHVNSTLTIGHKTFHVSCVTFS